MNESNVDRPDDVVVVSGFLVTKRKKKIASEVASRGRRAASNFMLMRTRCCYLSEDVCGCESGSAVERAKDR